MSLRRIVQTVSLLLFLTLFFYVCWPYGSRHHADAMRAREIVDAELFLAVDPLVSLSTALAAKAWVWSLPWAGAVLLICLAVPRGFCSYVCPLGTTIGLFDWSIGRRLERLIHPRRRPEVASSSLPRSHSPTLSRSHTPTRPWWVHLRYYLLLAVLVASGFGVLLSGFFAAIPVFTRAMQFILAPVQMGVFNGWYLVPRMNPGQWVSIGLFVAVLGLGLLRPRFWCRHICPSGAIFSLANSLRLTERKVTSACIGCGKCVKACPFDAIQPDFTTRTADCTFCRTCSGVCPVHAIRFRGRWSPIAPSFDRAAVALARESGVVPPHSKASSGAAAGRGPHDGSLVPPRASSPALECGGTTPLLAVGGAPDIPRGPSGGISRRGILVAGALCGAAGAFGVRRATATVSQDCPIRPPGSVPEREFLQLCIRCGECFKVCPYNVLQPVGFGRGLDHLWTPQAVYDWAGCHQTCANCGQVCPTGAIRALPLAEKAAARMGLAIVNEATCLPYAGRQACQLCVDECTRAGYNAIEFVRVGVETDENGLPVEGSGFRAPVVLADKCNGCGLCHFQCHRKWVVQDGLLTETAIRVVGGPGKEDRLMRGSYLALRDEERKRKEEEQRKQGGGGSYLPDFLK